MDEFSLNKNSSQIYLDNSGAAQPTKAQLQAAFEELAVGNFANPHSSAAVREAIEQARLSVLRHFNTTPDDYTVVFTSGTTAALRMVADLFDFRKCEACSTQAMPKLLPKNYAGLDTQFRGFMFQQNHGSISPPAFAYLIDNHTSVLGMREVVKSKKGKIDPELYCVTEQNVEELLRQQRDKTICKKNDVCRCRCLFVYPGQSNFCGRKYPLQWLESIRNYGLSSGQWYSCLDAAALVGTSPLNLSIHQPDFLTVSFYKIFGYPTGLGTFLVRNASAHALSKKYFGGGTAQVVLPTLDFYIPRQNLSQSLEDGTPPYQQILGLKHGFNALDSSGGIGAILKRTFEMAKKCFDELSQMKHANGRSVAVLYCNSKFLSNEVQGATVTFNLLRPDGSFVGYAEVQQLSDAFGIQLRTGCFCNVGACQQYLDLTNEQIIKNFKEGKVCGDQRDLLDGRPLGSVRISFGHLSTPADVKAFLTFITTCFGNRDYSIALTQLKTELEPSIMPHKSGHSCRAPNQHSDVNRTSIPRADDMQCLDSCIITNGSCNKPDQFPFMENGYENDSRSTDSSKVVSFTGDEQKYNNLWRVTDIYVYPVKSAALIKARTWPLCETGFLYDRSFAVVASGGQCLNQKLEPLLCRLVPEISADFTMLKLAFVDKEHVVKNGFVQKLHWISQTFAENNILHKIQEDKHRVTDTCYTRICRDNISVADCGDDAAKFLSSNFGKTCYRLVRQDIMKARRDRDLESSSKLSLVNTQQFLMVSRSSVRKMLEALKNANLELTENDLISRLRPNIVIDGDGQAFEEESWNQIRIGNEVFKVTGSCTRCQMICIDQLDGVRNNQILMSLRSLRGSQFNFGVYLRRLNEEIRNDSMHYISVGDSVFTES